ncbi:MAG: hypothetical protein AAF447_16560 [Myxococcota bacterium]
MSSEARYTEAELRRALVEAFRTVPMGQVIDETVRIARRHRGVTPVAPPRVRPRDVAELLRKKATR